MKKSTLYTFLALVAVFALMAISSRNRMVGLDEDVNNSWSKVQSQYQRRADLIPNLVKTVKGYAEHEKSTLEAVVNARAKATSIQIDPSNMTAESMKKFQDAQAGFRGALDRLLVSVERYPDLKASEGFRDFQTQLESTENRITKARDNFNGDVTTYNKKVRNFPSNIFASMFGFSRKATFQAQSGTETVPDVNF